MNRIAGKDFQEFFLKVLKEKKLTLYIRYVLFDVWVDNMKKVDEGWKFKQ